MAGIEIGQDVQIAIGPEAQRQHRPKQRKPTYGFPRKTRSAQESDNLREWPAFSEKGPLASLRR
jgi:hypothetical protein